MSEQEQDQEQPPTYQQTVKVERVEHRIESGVDTQIVNWLDTSDSRMYNSITLPTAAPWVNPYDHLTFIWANPHHLDRPLSVSINGGEPIEYPPLISESMAIIKRQSDEIERLQSTLAESLDALRAVAGTHEHQWDAIDPQEAWYCTLCREESVDYAENVQQQARALLAKMETEKKTDGD